MREALSAERRIMRKILENCENEKELLKNNYLKEFKRSSFRHFNLIIGKNGSGKTRMLRFLRDVAEKYFMRH